MAFFGLTALGPQNTFSSSAKQARCIMIFSDEDFEESWNKIQGYKSEHGRLSKIGDIMKHLFHGPIPINDEKAIIESFENYSFETSETVSFNSYMKIMRKLRIEAEQEQIQFDSKSLKDTCDFNSNSLFLETLKKCGKRGWIKDKQSVPLTSNQEFGWNETQLQRPTHFRKGSEITKFQAELIKNGVY